MSKEIGPELPPGFNTNRGDERDDADNEENEECIGPALPPGFGLNKNDAENEESEEDIGPALPPGFNNNNNNDDDDDDDDDDSEDDFIGPRPPGSNDVADEEIAQSLFEFKCRMSEKKKKLEADTEESSARPEWMTKVPRDRTGAFGTGARAFRMTSAPEVDSSWEEKGGHIGKHKRQKEPSAQQGPQPKIQKRVEASYSSSSSSSSTRQKSLLEEHMELMKKGKAKTMNDEPPPGYWSGMGMRGSEKNSYFDRERDFEATQMDPTQLAKTLEGVGRLKDSFSSAGKSNKFM